MQQSKKSNRTKAPCKKVLWLIEIAVLICIVVSLSYIAFYLIDQYHSRSFTEKLQKQYVITKNADSDDKTSEDKKTLPQQIDFDSILEISRDAVAWLYQPEGVINYVVAQSDDNDYYLRRLLDGSQSRGGTLFIDYRNTADLSDWNTIIYGHNMKNGTMFSSILNYRSQEYYDENPFLYLYTPDENYKIEVFAAYITSTDDIIYTELQNKESRQKLVDQSLEKSLFDSGIEPEPDDKLITLSTCAYDFENARFVVIGKLTHNGR